MQSTSHTPMSPKALGALSHHVATFARLADVAGRSWPTPYIMLFATDHGTHVDRAAGRGGHGSDLPDDLEINLFWGVVR